MIILGGEKTYLICPDEIRANDCMVVKADYAPLFRIVKNNDGVTYVQFRDANRTRAVNRGAEFVAIPLDMLIAKLRELSV